MSNIIKRPLIERLRSIPTVEPHRILMAEAADAMHSMLTALESMTAIVRYNADRIGYAKGSPLDKQIRAAEAVIASVKGEA